MYTKEALLAQIDAARSSGTDLPTEIVMECIAASDEKVHYELMDLLDTIEWWPVLRARQSIAPPLSHELEIVFQFVIGYCIRYLVASGGAADDEERYPPLAAATSLCSWFERAWAGPLRSTQAQEQIKSLLACLYRAGDEILRARITHMFLEHVFENEDIAAFYKDWQDDPILKPAYETAIAWARNLKKQWPDNREMLRRGHFLPDMVARLCRMNQGEQLATLTQSANRDSVFL